MSLLSNYFSQIVSYNLTNSADKTDRNLVDIKIEFKNKTLTLFLNLEK